RSFGLSFPAWANCFNRAAVMGPYCCPSISQKTSTLMGKASPLRKWGCGDYPLERARLQARWRLRVKENPSPAPGRGDRERQGGSTSHLLALHALDEDARRLRTHDPRVGQLPGAELLAQLPPTDRHLLVPLRPVLIHQADAPQLLVEGGEADLHRLDEQLAL